MSRLPDGKIVWLEQGSSKIVNGEEQGSGLEHIVAAHQAEFVNDGGIAVDQIPNVLMNAINEGKIIGYSGKGTGRPIYETIVNDQKVKIGITVSSNGYIVGATYLGRVK